MKLNQPWFDARDSKDFVYRTPMGLVIISLDPRLLSPRSYKTGIILVGSVKLQLQQELWEVFPSKVECEFNLSA